MSLVLLSALLTTADASPLSRSTASLPSIEAPPQGEARWIARSMRMNGLPMTLQTFSSRLNAHAVLHHYEAWARGHDSDKTHRSSNGQWQILAIATSRHYITIQARDVVGGAEGTISVSVLPDQIALNLDTQFPHPTSAAIVNLQQFDDDGAQSEHISLISSRSIAIETQAFAQRLTLAGWQLVRAGSGKRVRRARIIEAHKGAQHALLTLLPDHADPTRTAIIVVWKKV